MIKLIVILLLLSGCSAINSVVTDRGAKAAEQTLNTAEYMTCVASPVGAVIKKYWVTPAAKTAWFRHCGYEKYLP